MRYRTLSILIFALAIVGCGKDVEEKSYAYLQMRIEGEDHDIFWDDLAASWEQGEGELKMDARGFQFQQCRIQIQGLQSVGDIPITGTGQFLYSDGLTFQPDQASGNIQIVELNRSTIKGTFVASFRDSYSNNQLKMTGSFGVFKK